MNVHPPDLFDPLLLFAERIILEMTERASLGRLGDITDAVRGRV